MPTGKGLGHAVRAGHAIGCTAIQVFTSSPQQWKAKPITGLQVSEFQSALAETGITHVFSHDSYLINLATDNIELREKSKIGILSEMERCATYGIGFTVSHVGAHVGQGEAKGLEQAAISLQEVLPKAPKGVMLLMETTAGQGSSLNYRFESIGMLLQALGYPENLGVCLDTCHIFAAGYDIRTKEGFKAVFDEFDAKVGLKHLKAIHCNDSKKPFASRADRHEHLGDGEIGPVAFEQLVTDERLSEIPILIETPDAETEHATNVARLWKWARGE